jgi:hypothetical protein
MRIANISPGPRFLHVKGQARLLEPGEAADLDLTEAEIANVRHQVDAGMLAWDGEAPRIGAQARDPDRPVVFHKGFGRHYVIGIDGEAMAGPFSKAEAQATLARMLGQGD